MKFTEGVHVGSEVSNWGEISGGEPDRSDRNVIVADNAKRGAADAPCS